MIFYLTYNDTPSGIYSSQVIDVVKYLNNELNADVKLVSFISLRGFLKHKKRITSEISNAIVLPMFPGVHRWRWNIILLYIISLIYQPTAIIGRSVLATQLAFKLKKLKRVKYVVYDGRGAIEAEWREYGVVSHPKMLKEISELEKESILKSDFRIAVSEQLVNFWQISHHYQSDRHVIIPCTLNHVFENITISDTTIEKSKKSLGFDNDDTVFIYSGSVAGWQSFELLKDFLIKNLELSLKNKVLFLSENDKNISDLQKQFPSQVFNKKVSQAQVPEYLLAGNYGILIREQSLTNKVASPVKFAEYLCCGLGVIISPNLGDYSEFVKENKCGILYEEFNFLNFDKVNLNKIALRKFTKKNHLLSYKLLLNRLMYS